MNEQSRRADTFLRGLLAGAVVGAVIAGSAIWERRRRGGAENAAPPLSGPGEAPAEGGAAAMAGTAPRPQGASAR